MTMNHNVLTAFTSVTFGCVAGEGSEVYGDESGYMGYGYASATTPKKCFNGYKSL
jgi:hypothetical protein